MPIGRPRRIFRGSRLPLRLPRRLPLPPLRALLLLALCSGVAGGARWIVGLEWHASARTVATEQLAAPADRVAVLDGGTLRLHDRVVGLIGVRPPPRGETCRRGDGPAVDCAAAATDALAALVRDAPVACEARVADGQGRPLAVCRANGIGLNLAMVADGWARAGRGLPGVEQQEADARSQRRGLWAANQTR